MSYKTHIQGTVNLHGSMTIYYYVVFSNKEVYIFIDEAPISQSIRPTKCHHLYRYLNQRPYNG